MGQFNRDLGILRAYYRRLLVYGLLGGGVLFILAGFLLAETITAARGDLAQLNPTLWFVNS